MSKPFLKFALDGGILKFKLDRSLTVPFTLFARGNHGASVGNQMMVEFSQDPHSGAQSIRMGDRDNIGIEEMILLSSGFTLQVKLSTTSGLWRSNMLSVASLSSFLMQDDNSVETKTPTSTSSGLLNTLYIGGNGAGTEDWRNHISDVALYDINLGTEEWALFERGYSPEHVRPNHLVAYLPLRGDVRDVVSGRLAEPILGFDIDAAWDYGEVGPRPTIRRQKGRSPVLNHAGNA